MARCTLMRGSLARLAVLAAASILGVGCGVRPGSGHGKVIDAVSKQPVPNAQVTVICYVASSWHGVKGIEYTTNSTAPDGAYFIDPANFRDCADIFGFAKKPGYVPNDMSLSQVSENKGIPEIIYVMNESDVPRLQLNASWRDVSAVPLEAGPQALGHFVRVYRAFKESQRIAVNPDQTKWVRDQYCLRLRDMFALLSAAQRAELDHEWGFRAGADDYRTQVLPYCAAEGP